MKSTKKTLLALSFIILGATGSVSAQDCDDELVIGDIQPLSGAYGQVGAQTHRGVVLAAKHYNEGSHPLNSTPCLNVAGKTYRIKTVVYDTLGTSEGAVAAANRLVFQDKTKYVVGTYGSGPSMAATDAVLYAQQDHSPRHRLGPESPRSGQALCVPARSDGKRVWSCVLAMGH